jgi:hypothetical protein
MTFLGCSPNSQGREPAAGGAAASSDDHKHACQLAVGQKIEPVTGPAFPNSQPITFPRSGEVTLVAFLEMWNRFLPKTVPHVVDLANRYRERGLTVILVDGEHDMSGEMAKFWRSHPVPFPILWDGSRAIHGKLRSSGATVALFDRSGVVRHVQAGNTNTDDIDVAALERETKALLEHPRSTVPSYPLPTCETQIGQRFPRAEYPRLDAPDKKIPIPAGPWTLVAIVATWSGPDKQAMPKLARIADAYRARGLTVVLVFIDDQPEGIVDFTRHSGAAALPAVHDVHLRISNELQPPTSPTFLLMDAQGVVRHILRGYHDGQLDADFDDVATKLFGH